MIYAFKLGHQPHISRTEITSILASWSIEYTVLSFDNTYLVLEITKDIDASLLMHTLGGTVKIMKQIENKKNPIDTAVEHLTRTTDGKIHFSFSGPDAKRTGLAIKKKLKALDRSVRFIEIKNTATIIHNHLVEKSSDLTQIKASLYVTLAVQDIDAYTTRDYQRPKSDSTSGMLPPKLARIMINLAGVDKDAHILDPFCGSGTILIEALSLGYTHLTGSDQSSKALQDTRDNIAWYRESRPDTSPNVELKKAPIQTLVNQIPQGSIDAIISEPYMGRPLRGHESIYALTEQARELRKLYQASFETFSTLLAPTGVCIFIIPIFKSGTTWIHTHADQDIQQYGLTIVPFDEKHPSLLYARENHLVGREIWRFEKQ